MPDNGIVQNIVNELGNPVLSTSVFEDGIEVEYITDPELIHERYGDQVDMVIDGGYGNLVASAIVNCTTGDIEIVREGERELE